MNPVELPGVQPPSVQLPWHVAQWRHISTLRASGRLPHALLLKGPSGVGKRRFAEQLARKLLCLSPDGGPCGVCKGCTLAEASSHPDFHRVSPLEDGKSIGIDQIRALIDRLILTVSVGMFKVGIVMPAERMTLAAANSLLKTLEEPPGNAILVLVSGLSAVLPATIRSRCQTLMFPAETGDSAVQWLQGQLAPEHDARSLLEATNGQPLSVLEWVETGELEQRANLATQLTDIATRKLEPLRAAAEWKKRGARQTLGAMLPMLAALTRSRIGVAQRSAPGAETEIMLQALAEQLDLRGLFGLYDKCLALRRLLATHSGLNEQLQLEEIAVRWYALTTSSESDNVNLRR